MTNPEINLGEATRVVTAGRDLKNYAGAVNPPVYHVSTIISKSVAELKAHSIREDGGDQVMTYGRRGSPTSWALENAVAELEGGYRTLAYPSGLAAIAGTLLAFLKSGDHLLMVDSVYAPTRRFCNQVLKRFGVETTYYDPQIDSGIRELLRPNTTVVFTESPGSHTFEMQDIPPSQRSHTHTVQKC